MAFGTLKVDTLTYTDGIGEANITVSGIAENLGRNLTVTGTVSGDVVIGGTRVYGLTVTGVSGLFTTVTGTTSRFTTQSGVTFTGTTANFVSGVFTTQVSGAVITGDTGRFTTFTGTNVSGVTAVFTTGTFTEVSPLASLTVTTGIVGSGSAASPGLIAIGDVDTGLYFPGINQIGIATSGVGRVLVDGSGNVNIDSGVFYIDAANNRVGVNKTNPATAFDVSGTVTASGFTGSLTGNASTATTLQTARTINGVSFDGSTNITISGSTTNAATFNAGGAGAAAGTTFDGSVARTISYNTIGAPSISGSNATGTWGISVSGNAATATKLATARNINGVAFDGTTDITIPATAANAVTFNNSGTGSATGITYDGSAAITVSYNTLGAPSTTGTNASGTWNIEILGNAASATALQTARNINGTSFNGTGDITITANTTNTLTRGSYLTGDNFNGSLATTWAVDATTTNTASKVVARDASGNFAAGTITASLSGNASTATILQTTRTINGTNFNGSQNITITAANPFSLTNGSYLTGSTYDGSGAVTWAVDATSTNTGNKVVARDTSGNFAAGTITANLIGNASTASTFQTARNINNASFNGSQDITITANTTNALTFNNGGAGVVSGSTFNGSGAVTISYNTIGAPSTGGANATGNWPINITGSAATLTTARTFTIGNTAKTFDGSASVTWTLNDIGCGDVFTTGTQTLTNKTISGGVYTSTVDVTGSYRSGITEVTGTDINCNSGNYFYKTITTNTSFSVSNVPSSRAYCFTFELQHDGGAVTWFSGVEWPGGIAPTLTAGKTSLFIFVTDNGGTRWRGAFLANYTN
jgi:hypothetical protein